MKYSITTIPGDGIGQEVMMETIKVLDVITAAGGHEIQYHNHLAGGAAIDETGHPLPQNTLDAALQADAVLLGAVGGPKWDHLEGEFRPERALLGLRKALGLFANLRPAVLHPALTDACPLHPDISRKGIDIMVVRELTGGLYFGKQQQLVDDDGLGAAYDTLYYHENEIRRILQVAFDLAKGRKGKVTSVDKANILESSRLWRRIAVEMGKEAPDVTLDHLYVDNASMQLIRTPDQFDVLVTENMFGDILSDEAGMITGSIGMLPSASLRSDRKGMYEPVHGSAPDIAGLDKANPLATILSAAMMLRLSLGLEKEASLVEQAVTDVLEAGLRTPDIMSPGCRLLGTRAMGDAVAEALKKRVVKGV